MAFRWLFILVWVATCLSACGESTVTPPKSAIEVAVVGGYAISLPSNYLVHSGPGEDTYFFQAWRDDGEVVFRVEVGGGTPYERKHFAELPGSYLYTERLLFESPGGQGAYYYEIDSDLWRQVKGIVVFSAASGDGFEEILRTSHTEDAFPEVLKALQTLRHS